MPRLGDMDPEEQIPEIQKPEWPEVCIDCMTTKHGLDPSIVLFCSFQWGCSRRREALLA